MRIVVSLGGSVINPGAINSGFLSDFKKILKKSSHSFYIVCGGGKIARDYIRAAQGLGVSGICLDDVGISATNLNAEFVASVLEAKRAKSFDEASNSNEKIVVSGGFFPGVTTDFVSVALASKSKSGVVVNISNVKGIYDKDPNKHESAVFMKKLTYDRLISLANEFELGMGENFIFDLAASKIAKRTKTRLVFLQGLKNFSDFLAKKPFIGSIIE